ALRQAIGGFARRGDSVHAARGALELAASLLARGRPSEARHALDDASAHSRRAGDDGLMTEVAVLSGVASTQLLPLQEADGVLSAALPAARARADAHGVMAGSLALARCAFWRGGFHECAQLAGRLSTPSMPPHLLVRAALLESRCAVGLHDFERAMRRA